MNNLGCSCTGYSGYVQKCASGYCNQACDFHWYGTYKSPNTTQCDRKNPNCGTFDPKCYTCQLPGDIIADFSKQATISKKKITALEGINTIKSIIYSDITDIELFSKTTEEQYKDYFRKLSDSTLSLSEQTLLLDQINTEFIENNALNLFMNVRNILTTKPENVINSENIKKFINQTMKNVLPNIITSYNYGEDFLKMNYSNAYQSMYYATSLYVFKFKWDITRECYVNIK